MNVNTDLITAAQQGNLGQVVLCIQNGADPKLWNSQALSEAAIHNHLEVVQYLTPLSDVNVDCAVALRNAFLHNNTDVINYLWDHVDHELIIEQTQFVRRTSPFQLACQHGFYQHAISLLQYPFHRNMVWESKYYLPQVSNDPLCLKLWDELFIRVKDFGDDPAQYAVSSWHERPLPGLNILKIMAEHSAANPKSAQRFLDYLLKNQFTENHISAVLPIVDHVFDDLEDESKQLVVAKTVAYDPILSQTLINRCHNTQLLCATVVKEALYADMQTLIYMTSVWKTHTYMDDKREFENLENSLLGRICAAPEKVWCVVENFNHFLTPRVANVFIWLQEDQWTTRVCAVCSIECLQEAQALFNDETREYFYEYQNRVQRAKIANELSDDSKISVAKRM